MTSNTILALRGMTNVIQVGKTLKEMEHLVNSLFSAQVCPILIHYLYLHMYLYWFLYLYL